MSEAGRAFWEEKVPLWVLPRFHPRSQLPGFLPLPRPGLQGTLGIVDTMCNTTGCAWGPCCPPLPSLWLQCLQCEGKPSLVSRPGDYICLQLQDVSLAKNSFHNILKEPEKKVLNSWLNLIYIFHSVFFPVVFHKSPV